MTALTSGTDAQSGARLRAAMAAKHLTVAQLSRHAKVSEKSIRRWLSGAAINLENAYQVAKVLDVNPWDIWPDLAPAMVIPRPSSPENTTEPTPPLNDHGIIDVFVSRAELIGAYPPADILTAARQVRILGISLNLLVQSVSDKQLRAALSNGTEVQCLFLEPYSRYISDREREEHHTTGSLSALTNTNIDTLKRTRRLLPDDAANRLQLRTYHAPVRFNITVIDDTLAIVQFYLPDARGTESPSLVLRPTTTAPDLFTEFVTVFDSTWTTAREA